MPNSPDATLRLQDYLPYRLSVAANAVSRLIARSYERQFGLKIPQWRLLAVLADEGPLTQQALCGRTIMDKVTVMRAARGLLRRRLIGGRPLAPAGAHGRRTSALPAHRAAGAGVPGAGSKRYRSPRDHSPATVAETGRTRCDSARPDIIAR